jgi:hypothetical protein
MEERRGQRAPERRLMPEQLEIDEGFVAHMEAMCSTEREWMSKPLLVETSDVRYVVVSDGHMMVAVRLPVESTPSRGNVYINEEHLGKPTDMGYSGMSRFIDEEPPKDAPYVEANVIHTTVSRLRDWTGPPIWRPKCDHCNGVGQAPSPGTCSACEGSGEESCVCMDCDNEHVRDCGKCGGSGDDEAKKGEMAPCHECNGSGASKRFVSRLVDSTAEDGMSTDCGLVAKISIDRRRLACLLSVVDGDCTVWGDKGSDGGAGKRLAIRGNGWHISLMALLGDTKTEFVP